MTALSGDPADATRACLRAPEWLASIPDTTAAAMVAVDARGRTLFWNLGAEALFGWHRSTVTGREPPIVPAVLRQEWRLQLQHVLSSGRDSPAAETQRITRDGRIIPVLRSASALRTPDGQLIGVIDTLIDITAHKQLDEESRALAQVRERELIAMDLHDGLVQALYGVVLGLSASERALALQAGSGAAAQALRQARCNVEHVIEEARDYLFDLRTREFAPRDLGSALRLLADGVRLNGSIDAAVDLEPGVEQCLEGATRGHLVFFVREAVSNVLRHAEATRVEISLRRSGKAFLLRLTDDGKGYARSEGKRPHQRGLRNMAERARLIGARLEVDTQPGRGTEIRLLVPASR
jgi:PAS domain S-box-containing protein